MYLYGKKDRDKNSANKMKKQEIRERKVTIAL